MPETRRRGPSCPSSLCMLSYLAPAVHDRQSSVLVPGQGSLGSLICTSPYSGPQSKPCPPLSEGGKAFPCPPYLYLCRLLCGVGQAELHFPLHSPLCPEPQCVQPWLPQQSQMISPVKSGTVAKPQFKLPSCMGHATFASYVLLTFSFPAFPTQAPTTPTPAPWGNRVGVSQEQVLPARHILIQTSSFPTLTALTLILCPNRKQGTYPTRSRMSCRLRSALPVSVAVTFPIIANSVTATCVLWRRFL